MKRFLPMLFTFLGRIALVFAVCGGASYSANAEGALDRLRKAGFARVGFVQEVPFGYATPDGDLVGSEVDVVREVLKRIGVPEMQGTLTKFDSLIPGLQANRFDVAVSMFIRPKRCEVVFFTQPHETAVDGMVVQKGNPLNIHSMEQFAKSKNLRLGLGAGEITLEWADKLGIPKEQISIFPDQTAAWAGITAKRVDALILSSLAVGTLFLNDPKANLERVSDFKNPVIDGKRPINYVGIPFRKEDSDLRDAFNDALQAMVKDKSILTVIGKYGYTEADLPPADTPPLEQICKP
jgi:polar amino acid transport system substrate-binding protein